MEKICGSELSPQLGYSVFLYPNRNITLNTGEQVMVWRKTWAEREVEFGRDCEAEILISDNVPSKANTITSDSSKKYKIKYLIDNTTYEARGDILIKVWNKKTYSPHDGILLVTFDTESYRRLCWSQPQPTDLVIEIGSSYGKATEIIAKRKCKGLVGIDTSTSLVDHCRIAYPQLRFECFDVLTEMHKLISLCKDHLLSSSLAHPSLNDIIVYVDIGGNRELETVVTVVEMVREKIRPRLIVLKSEAVFRSAEIHLKENPIDHTEGFLSRSNEWWQNLKMMQVEGAIRVTAAARAARRLARLEERKAKESKDATTKKANADVTIVHSLGIK